MLTNLLRTLPEVDAGREYVAIATEAGAAALARAGADVETLVASPQRGLLWELQGVADAAARVRADGLFTVRELVPRRGPRTVVHLFEPPAYRLRAGAPRSAQEAKHLAKDLLLHLALGRSLRRAAAVTAGSSTTAAWIRGRHGVDARVVLPGIDPVFLDESAPPPPPERPFALHPATGDRRENTPLVLEAWTDPGLADVALRLVGTPDAQRRRVEQQARALGIADRVEVLGWVTDERLRELYRTAVALLHPTRYEGYAGYPALEAMALGTPVVALAAPGATEALADAALLVEREDARLVAAAVRRLVDDDGLRRTLGARGRERARRLTWRSTAEALAAVLADAVG